MTEQSDVPLPLAYPEQPNPPARPTDRDANVRLAAVNLALPEIIEWLGKDFDHNPDRDAVICDLLVVLGEHDGYRAARRLESECGWVGADENLVDILAGLSSTLMAAEHAAVKVWAEANGIRPRLSIGDTIETPHGIGTIVRIDEDQASYVVETEEHQRKYGPGRGGVIVAYEKCAAAKAEAA